MSAYIQAAAQISIQKPLSDEWLTDPLVYEVPFRRAIEADYKPFIDPVSARRMGKILKRAIATAATVAGESGISSPDAIICGTGLGCIENTEKFLSAMVNEGNRSFNPLISLTPPTIQSARILPFISNATVITVPMCIWVFLSNVPSSMPLCNSRLDVSALPW